MAKFSPEKAASFLRDELKQDPEEKLFSSSTDKVGEREAMDLSCFRCM